MYLYICLYTAAPSRMYAAGVKKGGMLNVVMRKV